MRPTRPIGGLIGLLVIGGVAAGCGTARQNPSGAVRPSAPLSNHPDRARITFLAPAKGALVGSAVAARVKVSGRGRVRFILDGGRPRIAAASAITYRHLAPGRHRLVAQLLASAELRPTATATTRFDVRRAHTPPARSSAQAPTASTPPPIATAPAPAASRPAPAAPPAPTVAPHAPGPNPRPSPAPPTHAGGGIPQSGGGDGDGDNSGGPSDGDGNV